MCFHGLKAHALCAYNCKLKPKEIAARLPTLLVKTVTFFDTINNLRSTIIR